MNAIERWDKEIAAKVSAGMSHQEAKRATVKEKPELHQQYLVAYNATHGRGAGVVAKRPASNRNATKRPASNNAIDAYNEAVTKVCATRGCARHEAVRIVNKAQPALREAYVKAHNEMHGHGKAYADRARRLNIETDDDVVDVPAFNSADVPALKRGSSLSKEQVAAFWHQHYFGRVTPLPV